MRFSRCCPQRAFTLIELLVVISVITLLVAILLPALKSARTAGKKTTSLTNIRQLMIATNAYAADHRQYGVPPAWDNTTTWYWTQSLAARQYVTNMRMYWSPDRVTTKHDWVNPHYLREWAFPGYAVNSWAAPDAAELGTVYDAASGGPVYRLLNLAQAMPPPARFVAFIEAWRPTTFNTDGYDGVARATPLNSGGWNDGGSMFFSYNGGVVRSFWDGHASGNDGQELFWQVTTQRTGLFTTTGASQIRYRKPYYRGWSLKWLD